MPILRSFLGILLFLISSSYTLRCTTNCYYRLNVTTPFYIPDFCNQTASAGRCEVDITVGHENNEYRVALTSQSSDYIMDDRLHVMFQLLNDASTYLSYSSHHECKNKDDCAREFAINKAPEILSRPRFDYRSIEAELKPLLLAGLSTEHTDLVCFDSNENVRQCSIATIKGVCEVSDYLTEKKQIIRSCNNENYTTSNYVSIYDSGSFAKFDFKCNRSLCNGPMTMGAVKKIMYKYNVTKTIEGRLNNSLRLTFSSTFLMLLIVSLLLSQN